MNEKTGSAVEHQEGIKKTSEALAVMASAFSALSGTHKSGLNPFSGRRQDARAHVWNPLGLEKKFLDVIKKQLAWSDADFRVFSDWIQAAYEVRRDDPRHGERHEMRAKGRQMKKTLEMVIEKRDANNSLEDSPRTLVDAFWKKNTDPRVLNMLGRLGLFTDAFNPIQDARRNIEHKDLHTEGDRRELDHFLCGQIERETFKLAENGNIILVNEIFAAAPHFRKTPIGGYVYCVKNARDKETGNVFLKGMIYKVDAGYGKVQRIRPDGINPQPGVMADMEVRFTLTPMRALQDIRASRAVEKTLNIKKKN